MRYVLFALALMPTPALADFECSITRQCGGGACEPFEGIMLVRELGDTWQVEIAGATYDGYTTTTMDTGGMASIVLPPQQDISGLISIYPTGEVTFTVHAYSGMAVAITGEGNCMTEGG